MQPATSALAGATTGKENLENGSAPTSLVVPAAAWHALNARLVELQDGQREVKAYLKANLKLEHQRRNSAAVRVEAAWRGALVRSYHPLALRLARRRAARAREASLTVARLHLTVPLLPEMADLSARLRADLVRPVATALTAMQRFARGFLVRRRVALWRVQTRAAVRVQSAARGLRSRRRHAAALGQHRLAARVARLEGELAAERSMRKLHEQFLRKLGDAVRKLEPSRPTCEEASPVSAGTWTPPSVVKPPHTHAEAERTTVEVQHAWLASQAGKAHKASLSPTAEVLGSGL